MTNIQRVATSASLIAELSHIFCCGLPIFIAVMSAGSQVGFGGGFMAFHGLIHHYEVQILAGSGLLLAIGLMLHWVSYKIDCRTTGCHHGACEPKKFRVGWIFTIALVLYAANVTFYIYSGHGHEPPRFSELQLLFA